jgi:hypothetical protein
MTRNYAFKTASNTSGVFERKLLFFLANFLSLYQSRKWGALNNRLRTYPQNLIRVMPA